MSRPQAGKAGEPAQPSLPQPRRKTPIMLNVYDLIEHNDWTYWCGVGIFHSGVEVHGVEYAFGGHEFDAPGVFATAPRDAPGTVTWREAVAVGETDLTPAEVYQVVQQMGQQYRGNRYHLLQMNCNNFSSDLCYRLTGERAPAWVNRLANLAVSLHCLLPQGWVPPLRPPTAVAALDALAKDQAEDERRRLLNPLDAGPSSEPYKPAPQLIT